MATRFEIRLQGQVQGGLGNVHLVERDALDALRGTGAEEVCGWTDVDDGSAARAAANVLERYARTLAEGGSEEDLQEQVYGVRWRCGWRDGTDPAGPHDGDVEWEAVLAGNGPTVVLRRGPEGDVSVLANSNGTSVAIPLDEGTRATAEAIANACFMS